MIAHKKRIVLFLPHRADPEKGEMVCADLLPLELLQIATGPVADGYEIVMIDAMVEPDYTRKVLEACDGALCFASSCILGFQVFDGYRVAKAVRERFPKLPIIWGGWFPSVIPDMYLESGIADAVGIGQGELTFREVVQALDSGADLEQVPGLALRREGRTVFTAHREVVGFEQFQPVPWHLLDFEKYAEIQARPTKLKIRHRFPVSPDWTPGRQPRGFSHFASFGCPEPCTFCCSPLVTGRRYKAIPGDKLGEEIAELQQRFRFDVLRFQDANWGVAEKRTKAFCEKMIELKVPVHWNASIEVETIMRYKEATLDAVRDSQCHLLWLGAEAGNQETQKRIKKEIRIDSIPTSIDRLAQRNIVPGVFWIIGYPGESRESMTDTLQQAALVKHRFPMASSEVYPFRAIPGTEDFDSAVKLGYRPPSNFHEWGDSFSFDYKYNGHYTELPEDIRHTWKLYNNTAAIYDKHVKEGPMWMRDLLSKFAGWRLKTGKYGFPVEQKLFDMYVRATGQMQPGAHDYVPAIDV